MKTSLLHPSVAVLFETAADHDAELWLVVAQETQSETNARLAMRRSTEPACWVTEWFELPLGNIMGLSYRREEQPRRFNLTHTSVEEREVLFDGVTVRFRFDAPPRLD